MKHKSKDKSKGQKEAGTREPEELRRQIVELQAEKDEIFGRLQRVSADYANSQKRAAKQVADTIAYEKEKMVRTLLPALDNFEHTLQNANSSDDIDVVVKGVRIVYDQLLDILKSHGVEQIKAVGESFDPAIHEAMMQECRPEQEENIVLEEFQKGYKLNGRVIRPSKVIVNKLPLEETQEEQQEQVGEEESQKEQVDLQEQPTEEDPVTETE